MDRVAIESYGMDSYLLMTRAAQDSFEVLRSAWPEARSIGVVCGAGNNAGDGYVLARLAMDAGWVVGVMAVHAPDKLTGDARRAHEDYCARGGRVTALDVDSLPVADVVVDALLGTGLSRDLNGAYLEAVRWCNRSNVPVLSLDVPSGLNAQSGFATPEAVQAEVTVTFIAAKIGLYTSDAPRHCGRVVLRDLDVPDEVRARYAPVSRLLDDHDLGRCLVPRRADAHKGQHGRVLIIGGDQSMSGAVALAGGAALRSGAGTVTVACHPDSRTAVASFMPELMCVGVRTKEELTELLAACDVVALGPGLGRGTWGQEMFGAVASHSLPTVVDADGLRWLATGEVQSSANPRIFTPHPGEAAGLLSCTTADIQADRLQTASFIASRYGGATVLKGAGSVVASRQGELALCAAGNPGMATAGSGDVLTGIAAGLWAQQPDRTRREFEVLCAAVLVHARAGDAAAAAGERGLIATDILANVRACIN